MTPPTYVADLARALKIGAPPRELARIVRNAEPARDPVWFKSFSAGDPALRAALDPQQRPVVWATHSSTNTKDLHGTWWSPTALQRMLHEARGLTAFMNHRYDVPEDVFGTLTEGRLVPRAADDGIRHIDLDMATLVQTENPRAVKSYRMIGNGTRLGQSVGVILLDWEWQDADGKRIGEVQETFGSVAPHDQEDARLTVMDVAFIETSVVGIPSVRRSWQHAATEALQRAGVLPVPGAPKTRTQFGGATLPAGERTGDVARDEQPVPTGGTMPTTAGAAPAHPAGGDPTATGDLPADDQGDEGLDAEALAVLAGRTAAFADGLADPEADLEALDAAYNGAMGVSDDRRQVIAAEQAARQVARPPVPARAPAPTGEDPEKKRARKLEKLAIKAARKAEKRLAREQVTVSTATDHGVSLNSTAPSAPPPAATAPPPPAQTSAPGATDERMAEMSRMYRALEEQIATMRTERKLLRKIARAAGQAVKRADESGFGRPTRRAFPETVELPDVALIAMSDEEAMDALAAGRMP